MKFTIRELTTSNITADYDDGSWAVVPIIKGQTKDQIIDSIAAYNEKTNEFDKLEDIPVKKGDVLEQIELGDVPSNYREARRAHYPDTNDQLDALYWARCGDDTTLKAIDAEIKLVKDTIPKNWSGKQSEIEGLLD